MTGQAWFTSHIWCHITNTSCTCNVDYFHTLLLQWKLCTSNMLLCSLVFVIHLFTHSLDLSFAMYRSSNFSPSGSNSDSLRNPSSSTKQISWPSYKEIKFHVGLSSVHIQKNVINHLLLLHCCPNVIYLTALMELHSHFRSEFCDRERKKYTW